MVYLGNSFFRQSIFSTTVLVKLDVLALPSSTATKNGRLLLAEVVVVVMVLVKTESEHVRGLYLWAQ